MAVVLVDEDGPITTITLNRPERRNGVTTVMVEELFAAVQQVALSDARVVILRGAGDHFSVGADFGGDEDDQISVPPTLERLGRNYHSSTLLQTMPQVTIAAIDGGCAGAGMGWALACDLRFASERARFATAFLKVEVAGDMGLIWSLVHTVGPARARELMLLPEKLSAAQALDLGLLSRVVSDDTLHHEVHAVADELAAHDPFTLRMMKENLVAAGRLDLRDYIELESARHLHVTNRPEVLAAFAKRRNG